MDHAEARIAAEIGTVLSRAAAGMTVFADGNLPRAAMQCVIDAARQTGFFLAIDAVSIAKSRRLPSDLAGVGIIFMNADEAAEVLGEPPDDPARLAQLLCGRGAARAVVTAGAGGACGCENGAVFHASSLKAAVADVTGAGDSLIAATLWRLSLGESLADALPWGVLSAGLTVESEKSVRPDLSPAFLERNRWRIATS